MVDNEKRALAIKLAKFIKEETAVQLSLNNFSDVTKPGKIISLDDDLLEFREFFFGGLITLPWSSIDAIAELPFDEELAKVA